MLLNQETLKGIAEGRISLAFRRWRRPTVRPGGTLMTTIGVLSVDAVDPVPIDAIEESEAGAAGFEDLATLKTALARHKEGEVYRIVLRRTGPDPRIELRGRIPTESADLEAIRTRLARWDRSSPSGPWTGGVLSQIERAPGVRAADLAQQMEMDRVRYKTNVRKLKGIGLTESLKVGYRLSPRGKAYLRFVRGPQTIERP